MHSEVENTFPEGDRMMNKGLLDESQYKVVTVRGGYHLVLAPPGCGKTHTLAERICYAHNHGVGYDDMICMTLHQPCIKGDAQQDKTANQ